MDEMYTYEEYAEVSRERGCCDEINIMLGYKYYVACYHEDEEEMLKADMNIWWNNKYRFEGRFN